MGFVHKLIIAENIKNYKEVQIYGDIQVFFPTGTTVYDKEKAFNGYTVFPSAKGALLIDMNGREVQLWAGAGRLSQ